MPSVQIRLHGAWSDGESDSPSEARRPALARAVLRSAEGRGSGVRTSEEPSVRIGLRSDLGAGNKAR
eukprot:3197616-Prymnesium_polylepis.1